MQKNILKQRLEGRKIQSYSFMKVIGSGAFGEVYEAFNGLNGQQVAIKAIPLELYQMPRHKELIENEIKVMKACKGHPNIVQFIDTFRAGRSLLIVMQLCPDGSLKNYIQQKEQKLTQSKALIFLKQIINGFKGLHQHNIIHRDLKCDNILLKQQKLKIADFGFSKMLNRQQSLVRSALGTPLSMAPEIHENQPYGLKADVWSLGIVFYQLIYGRCPYQGSTEVEIYNKLKRPPNFKGVNISLQSKNFIERCLTFSQQKRISWKQVYQHKLIVGTQLEVTSQLKYRMAQIDPATSNFYEKKQEELQIKLNPQTIQEELEEGNLSFYDGPFKKRKVKQQPSFNNTFTAGFNLHLKKQTNNRVCNSNAEQKQSLIIKDQPKKCQKQQSKPKRINVLKMQKQPTGNQKIFNNNAVGILQKSLEIRKQEKSQQIDEKELGRLREQIRVKKKRERALRELMDSYLKRRQQIVLVQKYCIPYFRVLSELKVFHANYLFLLCKEAITELRQFYESIKERVNIFGQLEQYFCEFSSGPFCFQLQQLIHNDLEVMAMSIIQYKQLINSPNPFLKYQAGSIDVLSKEWKQRLEQQVQEYRSILMDCVEQPKEEFRQQRLIIWIKALDYYLSGQQLQQLEVQISHLNFQKQEKAIYKRISQNLSKFAF